jgi:hypothetical protein
MQQPNVNTEAQPASQPELPGAGLALLKRAVVVVAVGSFAAVASLAAERTAAHGASTPGAQQTNRVNQDEDGGGDYFGYSPYGDDSGSSGSLGSGSGAAPAAGSHAS